MADSAILAAQHGRTLAGVAGQRRGLRLDHRHRIALARRPFTARSPLAAPFGDRGLGGDFNGGDRTILTIPEAVLAGTVLSRAFVSWPVIAGPFVARPILTGAFIPRPVVPETVFPGPILARTIVAGSLFARTVITGPIVTGALFARAVVAVAPTIATTLTLTTLVVVAVAILAIAVLTVAVLTIIAGAIVALSVFEAVAARLVALTFTFTALGAVASGGFGRFRRFLGLGLEIDLVSRIGVLADDVADGAIRLDSPQHPEIVFGVLQVVLSQNPVAGR